MIDSKEPKKKSGDGGRGRQKERSKTEVPVLCVLFWVSNEELHGLQSLLQEQSGEIMTELISSAPRGEFVTDRSLYPASTEEACSSPVIHRTHPSVKENIKRQLFYGGFAVAGWRAGCYQPGERAMVLISLMGVILHTFLFFTLHWHLEI